MDRQIEGKREKMKKKEKKRKINTELSCYTYVKYNIKKNIYLSILSNI